jgi:hypothetical protein
MLIHKMAVAHWRLMRAWGMERSGLSQESDPTQSPDAPNRALDHFERFRATRTRHTEQTKAPEVQQ